MRFQDVVGQRAAKEGLLRMFDSGRLPHALLIAGREGLGGLPLAIAFAQYIYCEHREANDSCGECANCRKVAKLSHADLHITFPSISPKENTKAMSRYYFGEFREFVHDTPYGTTFEWLQFIDAGNKQGNISAEECHEVINMLYLKAYEGGKKVQIIWRPEFLGHEGNILLKLIEEPAPDTLLLLVAEELENILPTILSRTQMVRLSPLPAADISDALVKRAGVREESALRTAHIANGSYAEALRRLQHADNELLTDARGLFNSLFTNNGLALSKFAEESSKKGREQQKNFLEYLLHLVELAIRCKYLPETVRSLPSAEGSFVQKLAASALSAETLAAIAGEIGTTSYLIGRNAHQRTQMHALCIRMHRFISGRVVAAS